MNTKGQSQMNTKGQSQIDFCCNQIDSDPIPRRYIEFGITNCVLPVMTYYLAFTY